MKHRLWNRGFVGLGLTQFLGAANDNVLKFVLMIMALEGGVWAYRLGAGGQGLISFLFVVPFLVLSGYAGTLNDRVSKSRVTVWMKVLEVPIVLIAGIGFYLQNLWVTLGALFLLTTQSTFFGPAKYGMIPELVGEEKLSKANGLISMTTNLAVILGTYIGGVVSDRYCPPDQEVPQVAEAWLPLLVMGVIAVLGVGAALLLPKLPTGDRTVPFEWNPFSTYIVACREMARGPLLMVVITWAFFYFFAGLALLIIPEYKAVLGITGEESSRILGGLALAIGIGSAVAGYLSGNRIEPRMVPLGAAGLCVSFLLLGTITPTYTNVFVLIASAGFFAGFYIVPLLALIQKLSPPDERGRYIATSNAISFTFLALASALYWVIRGPFGDQPQKIFLLAAVLLLIGAAVLLFGLRGIVLLRGEGTGNGEPEKGTGNRESEKGTGNREQGGEA